MTSNMLDKTLFNFRTIIVRPFGKTVVTGVNGRLTVSPEELDLVHPTTTNPTTTTTTNPTTTTTTTTTTITTTTPATLSPPTATAVWMSHMTDEKGTVSQNSLFAQDNS